ncbi:MAG TPA: DUF4190 domain-containing protein [Gaiellaceae bacterium]
MTEVTDDTKVCPRCAERIKSAAVVCRFCGYDYEAAARPSAPPYKSPEPVFGEGTVYGTNGYAIASLICGVVWIGGLGSLLAVIFGFMARRQINDSGGRQGGGGMATAGIIIGFVGMAGALLWFITVLTAVSHMHPGPTFPSP